MTSPVQFRIGVSGTVDGQVNGVNKGDMMSIPTNDATRYVNLGYCQNPYSDNFNRADMGSLGTLWTEQTIPFLGITNHSVYPTATGETWGIATYYLPFTADNVTVSVTLGANVGVQDYLLIILGANTTGQCVAAECRGPGSSFSIYTMNDWAMDGLVDQLDVGTQPMNPGDTYSLQRVGKQYSILVNGSALSPSWTDSGGIQPIGASNRLVGFAIYGDTTDYRAVDYFSAQ